MVYCIHPFMNIGLATLLFQVHLPSFILYLKIMLLFYVNRTLRDLARSTYSIQTNNFPHIMQKYYQLGAVNIFNTYVPSASNKIHHQMILIITTSIRYGAAITYLHIVGCSCHNNLYYFNVIVVIDRRIVVLIR